MVASSSKCIVKFFTNIPSAVLGSAMTLGFQWISRFWKNRVSGTEAQILVFAHHCGGLITRKFPEDGAIILVFKADPGPKPDLLPIRTSVEIFRLIEIGLVLVDQHPYTFRLTDKGFKKAIRLMPHADTQNLNSPWPETRWRKFVRW